MGGIHFPPRGLMPLPRAAASNGEMERIREGKKRKERIIKMER